MGNDMESYLFVLTECFMPSKIDEPIPPLRTAVSPTKPWPALLQRPSSQEQRHVLKAMPLTLCIKSVFRPLAMLKSLIRNGYQRH